MSARNAFLIAAAIGVLSAGCATTPRPTAEITRARTLIEQAEKAGAQQYAAVEIDQARNKLRLADAANNDGKNEEARARANEAAADAELAMARTNSGEAKKSADEVQESTETLRHEAERNEANAPQPQTTTPPTPPPRSMP
jgi:lipopolysaccharide export LptBFGC system permease protein LptF